MNDARSCNTEASTLIDLVDAGEIIGNQLKDPYIREGFKRQIQEALSGRIVSDGICSEQTSLTIDEIADKVLDTLGK
jgi:hypothetical protein